MQRILNNIIKKHIEDSNDFALISKVSFIYIFSSVGIFATFIFGIVNITIDAIAIGTAEIILALMQVGNIVYFMKKNNILLTTNILNTLLYILLSMLLIHGGIEGSGIFWISMFPLVVYFIDNKHSKHWMILFIFTMLIIAILDYYHIIDTPYTFVIYRQAIFEFLTISFILYFYHNIIILQRQKLIETKNIFKEQKNLAKSSVKAKSEFLANMSHEIRTPLNAILGFVDLLKEESKGRKSMSYVSIIDKSSKSLLKIIEDILDFSKIESGKLDIDKVNFNTKAEFEIVTHLFEAKCSEKNITLFINLNDNLPQVINTDPLRIKQVITNLLSNAIKFTSNGKKIYVNIDYKDTRLHVSVKDEGKGIAKDKLSNIFESFSQEDSSTTRKYGGTGLGLSISRELVKLLGGELKVKSELNIGSEFYFCIPITIAKEVPIIEKNLESIDFDGNKILLVEDNKANQMFMKIVFKKLKLEFDIANDGLEAVEAFKNSKYDVILMDENMPNLNGIEATKQILEIEKDQNLVHTPIIALTANALKGDRERFLEAGMDEYLTKPLNKNTLSKTLDNILR